MRGARLAAWAMLVITCGGRVDDGGSAGVDATNPQGSDGAVTPEQLPWLSSDGAICANDQTLCTACDGGTHCAAGCPLNICPIGDAVVDASDALNADAGALDAASDADVLDEEEGGLLDAGEPATYVYQCTPLSKPPYCDVPDSGYPSALAYTGCYYTMCQAGQAECTQCICDVGGWTCGPVPRDPPATDAGD